MPPQDPDQERWFTECLHLHEPMLRAWLLSRFPKLQELDDVIQEAYFRVLTVREKQQLRSPKAFFFATARNLAIGHLRKFGVGSAELARGMNELAALEDDDEVSENAARNQEIEIMTRAIQSLPKRCRQVMTLRYVYGLSHKEIAAELGISLRTVEAQVTIGVKRCALFGTRYCGV